MSAMKVIQIISDAEAETIETIIEKKQALENLNILLKEDDKYKEVLLKCISENEKNKKDYEQWWEEVITKYNLNKYQSESLYVDYTQSVSINIDGVWNRLDCFGRNRYSWGSRNVIWDTRNFEKDISYFDRSKKD